MTARWRRAGMAALLSCGVVAATLAASVDERIEAMAGALSPMIVVDGEAPRTVSLAERMVELKVPAVSIAVFDEGRIAWARAWGVADRERGVLATRDTLFQAGSISKPVSAVAALRLVERGVLALDANVNDVLTSWKLPDNEFTRIRKVTLRTILNHTAGTTVWGFPGYAVDTPLPSLPRLLDGQGNTEAVRVFQVPGERWRYSGGGYTVMQLMLTDVTGTPFPELLRREVLVPAGMRASTFEQPPADLLRAKMAVGYQRDGTRVQGDWHLYPEMAAAGLWTTAEDLARFAIAVQASLRDGRPLLSQKMTRLMLQPGKNGHGLGPVLSPDGRRFGHGGADLGFQGEFTAHVDGGPGAVVLTNSDNGGVLARQILMTLAREEGWADASLQPQRRQRVALSSEALREYVGRYAGPGGGFRIMSGDGGLRLIAEGNPEAELVPEASDRFFFRENGATVRFEGTGETMVFVTPDGTRIPRIEP